MIRTFTIWLEEAQEEDVKRAILGAVPHQVLDAVKPRNADELMQAKVGIWNKQFGIVNSILEQGAIKPLLTPEKTEQIQNAFKQDRHDQLTFGDLLNMIMGREQTPAPVSEPTPNTNYAQQQPVALRHPDVPPASL